MYRYRVTLEELSPGLGAEKLQFEVENHDDILAVVRKMSGRVGLDEPSTMAFAVGLKLFSETILRNRENPLFSKLHTALGEFMKELKGQGRPHP